MCKTDKAFSQIIYELTTPNPITGKALISVPEAARVMSVSESTIYDYRADRTEPSYSKIKDLARLANSRGYHKLSLQFFDNNEGKANGCTQDETMRIIKQLSIIDDANDGETIINAGAAIEREARNLIAEGKSQ